jgi:hypothetical protein
VEVFYHPVGRYAVVWACWMFRRSPRAAHRKEVNWGPPDVMTAGTQNLLTHPWNRAFEKSTVVLVAISIASGQREDLSMTVNR